MKRQTQISKLPVWKKAIFGLLIAAAALCLLELVFAYFGVRPVIESHDPFVGFSKLPLYVDQPETNGQQVTTASNKLEYFNEQQFAKQKSPGTYRVFCLGGSTTYGRPYDDATSFPGWLRHLLPAADESKRWEVINAGGISYASYRVADVMQELVRYEPDLFIVYTGHNEFLEHREYSDLRGASNVRKVLTLGLARTRTYSAIDSIMRSVRRGNSSQYRLPAEVDTMLDHSSGPRGYLRDDTLSGQILRHFEFNLNRMVNISRGSGVDIMFVAPASNLTFSPFKNDFKEGLTSGGLQDFEAQLEQAKRQHEQGELEAALQSCGKAEKIDSRYPELHFVKGRVLMELGRTTEAEAAFSRAIDEDVCPLRAPSPFVDTIRASAMELQVPLVDFELLLKDHCLARRGHRITGDEYFLDHVHPTIATNRRLAVAIVDELVATGIAAESSTWDSTTVDRVAQEVEGKIDGRTHAVALRNLAEVLMWAGKFREGGQRAVEALRTMPKDPEALYYAGAYMEMLGHTEQARAHFRRVLNRPPRRDEAYRLRAAAFVAAGRDDSALEQYQVIFKSDPTDAESCNMIVALLIEQRRYQDVVAHCRRALKASPKNSEFRYRLANVLLKLGQRAEAIAEFEEAIRLDPNDADSQYELGIVLLEDGRTNEAIRRFHEALKLRPEMQGVAQYLEEAQRRRKGTTEQADPTEQDDSKASAGA